MKFTDQELLTALMNSPPSGTASDLANQLGATRQAVDNRLRKLEDEGLVSRIGQGNNSWVYGSRQVTAENLPLRAKVRNHSDFTIDIEHTERDDIRILLQAGPNGYQVDTFWEDDEGHTLQNSYWLTFGENPVSIPYENTHPRNPRIQEQEDEIVIFDPDPRAKEVGFEGAEIAITTCDNDCDGEFRATLRWTDRSKDERIFVIVIPLADPRVDDDTYYEYIEPVKVV